MAFLLFTEYYMVPDEVRQKELDFCLAFNSSAPFDKHYVFVHNLKEGKRAKELNSSVYLIYIFKKRPTFGYLFSLINKRVSNGDIWIFSNSDIVFDDSVKTLYKLEKETAVSLARWNVLGDYKYPFRSVLQVNSFVSQDSWAFKSKINQELEKIDFTPGTLGCENKLVLELRKYYHVINPCLEIKSYHIHKSNIRYYNRKNSSLPPVSSFVIPSTWEREVSFPELIILTLRSYRENLHYYNRV